MDNNDGYNPCKFRYYEIKEDFIILGINYKHLDYLLL